MSTVNNKKKTPKDKFPELRVLRSLWYEAMGGDTDAGEKLLSFLSQYKTVDAFMRHFAHMKINNSVSKKSVARKPKNPATAWERGQENFRKGATTIVVGGLPSLGRK